MTGNDTQGAERRDALAENEDRDALARLVMGHGSIIPCFPCAFAGTADCVDREHHRGNTPVPPDNAFRSTPDPSGAVWRGADQTIQGKCPDHRWVGWARRRA